MQTLTMRTGLPHSGRTRLLWLALASALVLTGCNSGGGDKAGSDGSSAATGASSSSSSASAKPYLPVPEGVDLTAQGSRLKVGDAAVVAYRPRQDQIGALDIRVTRLEKTTFRQSFKGWKLDAATMTTNPYFVHATVKNVGDTNLSGRPVPLYIVDGHNTLIEASTFASTFKPCPSTPFPAKFKPGASTKVCLVFLSPNKGDLTAVSFRPTQEFNPITWTGELQAPAPVKPKPSKKSKQQG